MDSPARPIRVLTGDASPRHRLPRRPLPRLLSRLLSWLPPALVAAACVLALAACGGGSDTSSASPGAGASSPGGSGPPTEARTTTHAGRVEGSDAYVAVRRLGEDVIAYVCDGDGIVAWFRGRAAGGRVSLTNARGAVLEASFGEAGFVGDVQLAGRRLSFSAEPVQAPAGLYRSEEQLGDTRRVGGWIVLPDGTQRGAVQTGTQTAPAPPLDATTATATVGGTTVQAAAANPTPPSTAAPAGVTTTAPAGVTTTAGAGATTAGAGSTTAPAGVTTTGPENVTTTGVGATAAPAGVTTVPGVATTVAAGASTTTAANAATATTTVPRAAGAVVQSCTTSALPGRVFDLVTRQQPLIIGFPGVGSVNLGTVAVSGPCNDDATLSFTGGSAQVFSGFLTGSQLSGTVDRQKTCFTGGTFNARSDLGLPALPVSEQMCIGYDRTFKAADALQNLFSNPPRVGPPPSIPATLGPLCPASGTGTLKGRLRWSNAFPTMQLPQGFTFRDGVIDFTCDRVRIAAQVGVPGASGASTAPPPAVLGAIDAVNLIEPAPGTVTFNGTGRTDNSFQAQLAFRGVPVLGSPVDFTGTVQGTSAGQITYDVAARITNASLGIPGFNLSEGNVRFTRDQTVIDGKATAANGEVALTLNGTYEAEDDWTANITVDTASPKGSGTWKPAPTMLPTLEVPRANFSGMLRRIDGAPVEFDATASLAAPVTIIEGNVVLRTASVRIANIAPPQGCPIQAGEAWIDLRGSGRLTLPQAPVVDLAASSCLGLQSGQFRLATTADLNSWKPKADLNLTVEQFGFEVVKVGNLLRIAGDGELRFENARGLARVEFRSPNTLIIDGGVDLSTLSLGGGSGHLILATQPVTAYTNPADPNLGSVDLVAGLTAVTSIQLDEPTRTFLVQKLGVPQGSVPERLQAKAQIGGAAVRLEAALQFPDVGLPMYVSCPSGTPCTDDTRTSMHLKSIFFRLESTGSLGLGASVNMHLPKPDAKGRASDITLVGSLTVTPPATLGIELSMVGTLNNALGIQGLVLSNMAVQGSLDFSASGVPVPVELGMTATVNDLPTFIKNPLGIVGTENMTFALNISPLSPIFQLTLGKPDNQTFLKPLTPLGTAYRDQLTVDIAEIYIAPLGGNVGEIQVAPGINVQFDGTIMGTLTKAKLTLDPTTLAMTGKLFVDSFAVSGMKVDQTDLSLEITPTKFDLDINGGFALPDGGPRATVDGRLLAQVGATDPIRLDLTATAANWTVQPGTTFSSFTLSVNGGLTSLSSPPNLTVAVNAAGAVLGTNVPNFGGAVVLATGELRYLGLQVNPATMVVGGTTVSGNGCRTRLTAPASVPARVLPGTTTSGVCVQFTYDKPGDAAAVVGTRLNGRLTSAGIQASVNGSIDATGLAFSGSLSLPSFGATTIDGRLFSGDAAALAAIPAAERPKNVDGIAVAPVTGDWRLNGTFAPTGPLNGTSLTLTGGRVGGQDFVKGNGTLRVGGTQLADGAIAFTSAQMTMSGSLNLPLPPKQGQTGGKVAVAVSGNVAYPTDKTGLSVTFTGDVNVAGGGITSNAAAAFTFLERKGQTTDRLDFDGIATNWPLSAGAKVDKLTVGFHADIPKTGLAANATASVNAELTVLERKVVLVGSGTMANGVVTAFDLAAGTSQITLGVDPNATIIGGKGCPGTAATDGPCVRLTYTASPLLAQIKLNGSLTTPGLTTSFDGTVGTSGVDFNGTTTMPNGDTVTVNGTIVTANGSGINVVRVNSDGSESTVAAVKNDISFGGTWSPKGLLDGSSLNLRSGRVGGIGFGHAKGATVVGGFPLSDARVTFTDTGSTVNGTTNLPVSSSPDCATLNPATGPVTIKLTGSFAAAEIILTGSQSQSACTGAASVEGRLVATPTRTTLSGTLRNFTFGPARLNSLKATLSSSTATTATIDSDATLLGVQVLGSGSATVSGGRVTAFNLAASSARVVVLSPNVTLTSGGTCGTGTAASLDGPCFTLDFSSTRSGADRLRSSFSGRTTVSGLTATLNGQIANGQTTVQGNLDTGRFGTVDVVGALFTDVPTSRTSSVSVDGSTYNLATIATGAGANFNNATKGDFVLGLKVGVNPAGSVGGFPLAGINVNAGRIGSVAWVRGSGDATVGESSVDVDGTISRSGTAINVNFTGNGVLKVGGYTLANGTVAITNTSAAVSGRVTAPNPAGGAALIDVTLTGTLCTNRCPALFPPTTTALTGAAGTSRSFTGGSGIGEPITGVAGTQTATTPDPAGPFFQLSQTAALRVSGFTVNGSYTLRKLAAGSASFTFAGDIDTAVVAANVSGNLAVSGTSVTLCATGTGSVKVSGADPTGTISFCTNPATVSVNLTRGDFRFSGNITSTSIALDASAAGVWIAVDWHPPCRVDNPATLNVNEGFASCRDRVTYNLTGKLRMSTSGTPTFSVEGSGQASWFTDKTNADPPPSSTEPRNAELIARVAFRTGPLRVCINVGGEKCSPALG